MNGKARESLAVVITSLFNPTEVALDGKGAKSKASSDGCTLGSAESAARLLCELLSRYRGLLS